MQLFIAFVTFLVAVSALSVEDAWSDFKREYSREYKSLREEKFRFEIFKNNLQKVNDHNERYERGEESYSIGINKFSDLTKKEIKKFFGHRKTEIEFVEQFEPPLNFTAPASIDWRSKGAVLSVKEQGDCGSCWAFSAIGAIEGQNAIKHKIKEDLSEQELIDCSTSFKNGGCDGGSFTFSWDYIKANGIATLKSYPYKAKNEKCSKSSKSRSKVKLTGYKKIGSTESALKTAVASVGPISVSINGDPIVGYRSGVYDSRECTPNLNHDVLLVGYGTEGGKDYWLVKNSWGAYWGDQGYIKIGRNMNNLCGIAMEPFYPIIS